MLLSPIIATMISADKFERNNLPFTIEDILKANSACMKLHRRVM